ncbi:hypothetical protein APSETT444_008112 [Aspergillus pseudonomiae]
MDVAVGIEDAKNAADPEAAMRALVAAYLQLSVVREHAMRISRAKPASRTTAIQAAGDPQQLDVFMEI